MINSFFKPTKKYKIYTILNMIDTVKKLTQREISQSLDISVSMVNQYLNELEEEDYIKRKYHTRKTVEYVLKPKGKNHKEILSIDYLNSTQKIYDNACAFILKSLAQMQKSGIKDLIFYGAGEVADIVLVTYQNSSMSHYFNVHAIIDDDPFKQNETLHNIPIISLENLNQTPYDVIFISSYTHQSVMEQTLKQKGISPSKIKRLFNA